MKVISHVILAIAQPEKMPDRIAEQWTKMMKENAAEIAKRLSIRIPDAEHFMQWVAGAAQAGYAQYVSKDYISEGGLSYEEIISRYATNIKDAYEKYRKGIEHSFETVDGEVAKRFKEKVDRAQEHYARGSAKVLAFTGCKITGKGCAPITAAWLTGQQKILGHIRPADQILEGGPILITTRQSAPALRTTLNHRLIQAGVTIRNANLAQTVLKTQNDQTNATTQGFVDKKLNLADFETGGDSRVDYLVDENGQLYLAVKVSEK